ncbi:hypothetical protein QD357_15650 [Rhizobium sp. BR 317]|uniref:hypothetical protein n=1 Tax=Rhizobium sp. BR 317 TaxID=3040015 RepID=UPI0039BF4A83
MNGSVDSKLLMNHNPTYRRHNQSKLKRLPWVLSASQLTIEEKGIMKSLVMPR